MERRLADMTDDLHTLLNSDSAPENLLGDLMPALCDALDCDRCVLFLRDPHTRRSRATHAWHLSGSSSRLFRNAHHHGF